MRMAASSFCVIALLAAFIFFVPPSPIIILSLAIILFAFALLAWKSPLLGCSMLLAAMPLVNNLAVMRFTGYFPPALLLFLVLVPSIQISRTKQDYDRVPPPLRVAIAWLIALTIGSALITLLRYTKGWPFTGSFEIHVVNLFMETNVTALREIFVTALVFISGPIFFLICTRVLRNVTDATRAIVAIAAGLALATAVGFAQAAIGAPQLNTEHFRARGQINATFIDPNALGSYVMIALPLLLIAALRIQTKIFRASCALLSAGALLLLVASGSRTGLAGLVIAAILISARALYFVFRRRAHRRIVFTKIAVAALLLAAIFGGLLMSPVARHSSLGQRLQQSAAIVRADGPFALIKSDRYELWRRAAVVTGIFPLTGVGIGAFRTEVPNFMMWYSPEYRDNAANYYLQVAVELGLPALVLVLCIYALILRQSWHLAFQRNETLRDAVGDSIPLIVLITMLLAFVTGPHTNPIDVMLLFWFSLSLAYANYHSTIASTGKTEQVLRFLPVAVIGHLALFTLISATSLSVRHQLLKFGIPASVGFYNPELKREGTWSSWTAQSAWMVVPANKPTVSMMIYAGHPDASELPVNVSILFNDQLLTTMEFAEPAARSITIELPRTNRNFGVLAFNVDRTWVPSRYDPSSEDHRDLGILISDMTFEDGEF